MQTPAVRSMPCRIETEADLAAGLSHLLRLDPRLERVAAAAGPVPLRRAEAGFAGLAGIIVAQMISKASAAAIWGRMAAHYGVVDAATFLASTEAEYRAFGLSAAKCAALRAAARAVQARELDLDAVCLMEGRATIAALSALPGIGRWTAEVYLVLRAGHPDVFPVGDVALQNAVAHGLGLAQRPSARDLEALAHAWSPWRSVAARLFWAYTTSVMRPDAAGSAGRRPRP